MDDEIIAYLKQGYTFNEIQDMLSIPSCDYSELLKKINFRIKENLLNKKVYSDGIIDKNNKEFKPTDLAIITRPDEQSVHFLVISDTHIGSSLDNILYIDYAYDYCIRNSISYIFHGGDLIDGSIGINEKRLLLNAQIEEVINNYPYDDSITNFITLGNHDLNSFSIIEDALIDYRDDLIPIGYGTNEVFLKNDSFIVSHFIPFEKKDGTYSRKLILKGHSHRFKVIANHDNYIVYIPTLSDLLFTDGFIPGFLDLTINFRHGYIDEVLIKTLGIINNKVYPIGVNKLLLGYKIPSRDLGLNVMEYTKRR